MKIILIIIGLLGTLLFGTAFVLSFSAPDKLENAAKGFIKERIEQETSEKIDSLTLSAQESRLGKIASRLLQNNKDEIAHLKSQLKTRAYEKLADVIAEMSDLSCECRKKHTAMIKQNIEIRLVSLQAANEKIHAFMKTKYMQIVQKLKRDIRIFSGCNLAVFLLLLAVSLVKPRAIIQLFLPGLLLVASTVICSYFYIFEQNWFFTILYNDYLGFGYLIYLGIVFALFCDIVFNRARITTEIVNGILNAIGSALSAAPC